MLTKNIKNLFLAYGIYIASWWLADLLALAYGKLTGRIIYHGAFAGTVLLGIVETVPYASVAALVGAFVVWLVDSERPLRWAIFPVVFYVFFGTIGYQWARLPMTLDRIAQFTDAAFMVIACVVGAAVVARRRASSQRAPDDHVAAPGPGR
jgi:hypothetical protein